MVSSALWRDEEILMFIYKVSKSDYAHEDDP
jgi:hypothetical protein